MCGIVAVVTSSPPADLGAAVETMTDTLTHRGPDDAGYAVLPRARRRARDAPPEHPRPRGRPASRCGTSERRRVRRLQRRDLQLRRAPARARGARASLRLAITATPRCSFTATRSGATALRERLNGMFAFAIWDGAAQRCLFVARDRAGREAALRRAAPAAGYVLASEMKALLRYPGRRPRRSTCAALEQYLELRLRRSRRARSSRTCRSCARQPFARSPPDGSRGAGVLVAAPTSPTSRGPSASCRQELDRLLDSSVEHADRRRRPGRPLPERRARLDDDRLVHGTRTATHVHSFSIGFDETSLRRVRLRGLAARTWARNTTSCSRRAARRARRRGSPRSSTSRWATSPSSRRTCSAP